MRAELAADDRGLGIGLVVFGAMLAIGAMLFTLLFLEGLSPLFSATDAAAETQQGADQIALAQQIGMGMGLYVMALAVLFLIARSVFESRGGA